MTASKYYLTAFKFEPEHHGAQIWACQWASTSRNSLLNCVMTASKFEPEHQGSHNLYKVMYKRPLKCPEKKMIYHIFKNVIRDKSYLFDLGLQKVVNFKFLFLLLLRQNRFYPFCGLALWKCTFEIWKKK